MVNARRGLATALLIGVGVGATACAGLLDIEDIQHVADDGAPNGDEGSPPGDATSSDGGGDDATTSGDAPSDTTRDVVATDVVAFDVVVPPDADTCADASTASFLVGDGGGVDYIWPGVVNVTSGVFEPTLLPADSSAPDTATIKVYPTDTSQGTTWTLEFSSKELSAPLTVQAYPNAMRAPFATPGHPGLEITVDSRGCNMISGSFEVKALRMCGPILQELLVDFVQDCDNGAQPLRGTLHYAR